mmetsp:Transcript_36075/g.102637  ORF Transcript_36075/g.102637 Transcript_36075/m.102637 type:complete len:340 (+) Transcript_36075:47-1066(+)
MMRVMGLQAQRSPCLTATVAVLLALPLLTLGRWVDSTAVDAAGAFENLAEESLPLVVIYDRAVVDSAAKTLLKAQELKSMQGVESVSAFNCVGMVKVNLASEGIRRLLMEDLSRDPHFTSARSGQHECNNTWLHAGITEPSQLSNRRNQSNGTGSSLVLATADTIEGSVTIPRLEVGIATSITSALVRIIAASFPKVAQEDVQVLQVKKTYMKASPSDAGRMPKQKSLRAGTAVHIDFQVTRPLAATDDDFKALGAQMQNLIAGGRATERFDVMLDAELQALGVSLPDWAQSVFSRKASAKEEVIEKIVLLVSIFVILLIPLTVFGAMYFLLKYHTSKF